MGTDVACRGPALPFSFPSPSIGSWGVGGWSCLIWFQFKGETGSMELGHVAPIMARLFRSCRENPAFGKLVWMSWQGWGVIWECLGVVSSFLGQPQYFWCKKPQQAAMAAISSQPLGSVLAPPSPEHLAAAESCRVSGEELQQKSSRRRDVGQNAS